MRKAVWRPRPGTSSSATSSAEHWIEIFRNYYGPVVKAFEALDDTAGAALEADINMLLEKFNVAKDGTLVIPSEYLEVVVTKNG